MNIFFLSTDPLLCAQYHNDRHVCKMVTEYAQLLSTCHYVLDGKQVGMKPSHINHPSAAWVRQSFANYSWLFDLYREVYKEYSFRYSPGHLGWDKYWQELQIAPANIKDTESLSPLPLAMPDECKTDDPVTSYRNYYRQHKQHLAKWSIRGVPCWWF